MKMTEKVRHATQEELAEMPKCLFHAYQQGRLIVKAVKTCVFFQCSPLDGGKNVRLDPGEYYTFFREFWKMDELVVLTEKAPWYWEKAEEAKAVTA